MVSNQSGLVPDVRLFCYHMGVVLRAAPFLFFNKNTSGCLGYALLRGIGVLDMSLMETMSLLLVCFRIKAGEVFLITRGFRSGGSQSAS